MAKSFDPNALFSQAKKMKDDMARVKEDLKQRMVEGKAPEDLVSVVANGLQEVEAIRIKPAAVDPDDLEELEDLILVAVRQALDKARALHEAEMSKITGGMDLPGMF
ncbi:MAG: YbaB/EbfC family nucleoid-associated protein [Planctomycetota bacterium]|nr:YbaB/EbfC family nucleoid-associated protein [Planctomycetota bacterium]